MGINTKQIALKKTPFTGAVIYYSRICKSNASSAITIVALVNALPLNSKPSFKSIYKCGYQK